MKASAAGTRHAPRAGTWIAKIGKLRSIARTWGLASALHALSLRAVNLIFRFKVLRGVSIERADSNFLQCPERYTAAFLSAAGLREFAADGENGLTQSFVEEALSKGDECYGICDGGRLVSYGWYSMEPTRIDPPDLFLGFNREYVYMYKGFTAPRFRGQRLHAIGMTLALDHYLSRGFKGLVSYIESNNFDSLRSSFRMGFVQFGSLYVMEIIGRHITYCGRGCERFELRLQSAPSSIGAAPPAFEAPLAPEEPETLAVDV